MAHIVAGDPRIDNWLRAIGIQNLANVQRVIIDIPVGEIVRAYVAYAADKMTFEVRFRDGEFEIVTVDKVVKDGVVDATSRGGNGLRKFEKVKKSGS